MSSRRSVSHRQATSGQGALNPGRRPIKRFGQHFLTDRNIIRRIVAAGEIARGDAVLEIGPGHGHLTRALLEAGANVVAVEIDRGLAASLRAETQAFPALSVLEGDFLTSKPREWLEKGGASHRPYKVVANLPYYITSAILRLLLESDDQPELIVVMVQREVAEQITARPPAMNLLGVSVQFFGDARIVGIVPAGAFVPRPQVDSAIVRVDVLRPSRFPDIDPQTFFQVVRAGFGVKRKQIHNALERGLKLGPASVALALSRAAIDPKRRAETLSLDEWRRLVSELA